MGKLSTPAWITEGYDSKADWEKAQGKKVTEKKDGKTFKLRVCPKCDSNKVNIVLVGEEGKKPNEWECKNCKWKGSDINIKEVTADELLELEEDDA